MTTECNREELPETAKGLDAIFELYFADLPDPGSQAAHERVEANREYLDRRDAEDRARAADSLAWADFHDLVLNS